MCSGVIPFLLLNWRSMWRSSCVCKDPFELNNGTAVGQIDFIRTACILQLNCFRLSRNSNATIGCQEHPCCFVVHSRMVLSDHQHQHQSMLFRVQVPSGHAGASNTICDNSNVTAAVKAGSHGCRARAAPRAKPTTACMIVIFPGQMNRRATISCLSHAPVDTRHILHSAVLQIPPAAATPQSLQTSPRGQ